MFIATSLIPVTFPSQSQNLILILNSRCRKFWNKLPKMGNFLQNQGKLPLSKSHIMTTVISHLFVRSLDLTFFSRKLCKKTPLSGCFSFNFSEKRHPFVEKVPLYWNLLPKVYQFFFFFFQRSAHLNKARPGLQFRFVRVVKKILSSFFFLYSFSHRKGQLEDASHQIFRSQPP